MPGNLPRSVAHGKPYLPPVAAMPRGKTTATGCGRLAAMQAPHGSDHVVAKVTRPRKNANLLAVEMARKLTALQAEMGQSDEDMASMLGIVRQTWTNWKNGWNKPVEEAMLVLCREGAVTMDWLYRGRTEAMNLGHAIRLTARLKGLDPDAATAAVLERG